MNARPRTLPTDERASHSHSTAFTRASRNGDSEKRCAFAIPPIKDYGERVIFGSSKKQKATSKSSFGFASFVSTVALLLCFKGKLETKSSLGIEPTQRFSTNFFHWNSLRIRLLASANSNPKSLVAKSWRETAPPKSERRTWRMLRDPATIVASAEQHI